MAAFKPSFLIAAGGIGDSLLLDANPFPIARAHPSVATVWISSRSSVALQHGWRVFLIFPSQQRSSCELLRWRPESYRRSLLREAGLVIGQ